MKDGPVGNPKEIYGEIGRLIWSIFPEDALESYFYCQSFPSFQDYKFNWLDVDGSISWYPFEQHPDDVLHLISVQLQELQKNQIFENDRWTHCKVTLTDKCKFNIVFAYVDEDDSWSGVYMKGISELTLEELEGACVPEDIWQHRKSSTKSGT
ncbi:Uncharacterised protein [Vibrio mimicus]|uniref:hypothetical protein n=1 Tax=Vibrio mimicus TaxID=674 RepID=UPI0002BB9952|nr:hypothetical protein [Vibrio mimicus]EMB49005.1 hypothetical protein D908_16064 [Vibrio mimicus CAIM 602]MBY7676656.1 hypothetical protein [Vibrio mimicus]MBY7728495.1 hypothetical protein [Vibrio mimicus]TXY30507.1 hypothetical protein FXE86_11610 [Vibrio mimicus]SUQ23482.1 Uncharacterised protein [Vibrio mimicus]